MKDWIATGPPRLKPALKPYGAQSGPPFLIRSLKIDAQSGREPGIPQGQGAGLTSHVQEAGLTSHVQGAGYTPPVQGAGYTPPVQGAWYTNHGG